mgnify:CR=1 FL=1
MKKKTLLNLLEIVLYFFAAFSFFGFAYVGLDMVSSVFASGYRTIPAFFAYLLPTLVLIVNHRITHAKSIGSEKSHAKIDGYILLGLCSYIISLDIAYFALNEYNGLIEGSVTPFYPLDTILLALLGGGYGIYLLVKSKSKITEIPFLFYPNNGAKLERFLSFLLKGIGLGFSLYMVGGLLWGLDFAYWDNPNFHHMIPLFILMVVIALFLGYDIYFESYPIKNFSFKAKRIILSCLSALTLLGIVWTTITFITFPDVIVKVGQPYFRVDIIGNLNIAPYVLTIPPVLYCLYLWTLPLIRRAISKR